MRTKVHGELIRRLREEKGLTVRELAEAAEVDRRTLWKIESGLQHGSPKSRLLLARTLGVPLSSIAYTVPTQRTSTEGVAA